MCFFHILQLLISAESEDISLSYGLSSLNEALTLKSLVVKHTNHIVIEITSNSSHSRKIKRVFQITMLNRYFTFSINRFIRTYLKTNIPFLEILLREIVCHQGWGTRAILLIENTKYS